MSQRINVGDVVKIGTEQRVYTVFHIDHTNSRGPVAGLQSDLPDRFELVSKLNLVLSKAPNPDAVVVSMNLRQAMVHNKQHAEGNVMISYAGMEFLVPRDEFLEVLEPLRAVSDRAAVMASVNFSLQRVLQKIRGGRLSQIEPNEAAAFMQDVAIWFANEVIDGRATFGEH